VLEGQDLILRYVARAGPSGQGLYGSGDPLLATQVDQWLAFAPQLVSGQQLESAVAAVNEFLSLRTFLVGYSLSLADLACWGRLQGERLRTEVGPLSNFTRCGRPNGPAMPQKLVPRKHSGFVRGGAESVPRCCRHRRPHTVPTFHSVFC
jgi:hypothetical protein